MNTKKFSIYDGWFLWLESSESLSDGRTLSADQNKPEFKNAFHWNISSAPYPAHDCVTVNVCRHDWSWGKKFKQRLWSAGLKQLHLNLLEVSLTCMYLTILTCSLVHNQAFQSVTAVCFISGLCGRDAHPQGCSWGQPGMYQSSLDLGSKSWVSRVIRSVFLLFLYSQHFCSTFARDHHQTLVAFKQTYKFPWDVNVTLKKHKFIIALNMKMYMLFFKHLCCKYYIKYFLNVHIMFRIISCTC